ncbi:hypothetical protein HCN44_000048 [Aphidius gifuensis]|uniref:Medium-chain acyl-CoA ligase ACSF2, mitochondrial n=2 Tax=Aphidius gifuensis TaxID=684658 RepID=A0A835CQI8_APHGI|nr:hypothetical protein HCN44_000048 [Aphidius gifuensis]
MLLSRLNFVQRYIIPVKLSRKYNTSSKVVDRNLSYKYVEGRLPLVDITVGQLMKQSVEQWPDRDCIVSLHQGIRLTYRDVLKKSDKFAAGLKNLGLKKGDRVAIWGVNDAEWLIAFLATSKIGLIMAGINYSFQQQEIDYCLNKVQAKAVLSPNYYKNQDNSKILLNSINNCPDLKHIILWGHDACVTGTRRFCDVENLASSIEVEAVEKDQDELSCNIGCNIQFTSGTTGLPKAPLLSHRSLVNNGIQIADRENLTESHHKICFNVPFFHAFGIVQGHMAGIAAGSTFVLQSPTFNPKHAIDAIVKEKCTIAFGTPTMWVNMLDVQERVNAPIKTLKMTVAGGAYVSPALRMKIENTFGIDNFMTVYGLTEGTAMMFQSQLGESAEVAHDTVGYVQNYIEAMVVGNDNLPVPFGSEGELWVRGYNVMMGYWEDIENTNKTINKDGWLKTGDKFILRKDGYGRIIGRLKDMIIRGGENIFPK